VITLLLRQRLKIEVTGKEILSEMKQKIVNLSQDGHSACKIAKILSMNRRTVAKIIKRYRERGSIVNLPQNGRGKKNEHKNRSPFVSDGTKQPTADFRRLDSWI
jgi:DNA invertase Pin-like site-specific DNA recombinase